MIKLKKIFVPATVVLITLLLGAAFYPQMCSMERAFELKAENDLSQLSGVIQLFELDNGNFPQSLEELEGEYLSKIISDPWGNRYEYISDGSKAIIFTYGDPNETKLIFRVETKKL